MPTANEDIGAKIDRAKQLFDELTHATATFLNGEPYRVDVKRDGGSKKPIYYVASVQDVPITIPCITADILQNLRTALDHIAWHLVLANGAVPGKHTSFPIYDNAAKFTAGFPGRLA